MIHIEPADQRKESAMIEQQIDRPRRKAIRALTGLISAGLVSWIARATAAEKMTRRQAEYQDAPNGIYSCGMCTLFEKPNACKVVEGEISKDGWCKAFAMAD
jgi:hypothetical protein